MNALQGQNEDLRKKNKKLNEENEKLIEENRKLRAFAIECIGRIEMIDQQYLLSVSTNIRNAAKNNDLVVSVVPTELEEYVQFLNEVGEENFLRDPERWFRYADWMR